MLRRVLVLIFMLVIFAFPVKSFSQGLHTISNKALKEYNEGKLAYNYLDLTRAETYLKEAIKTDPSFYEAYLIYAEMLSDLRRFNEAVFNYRKVISIDSLFFMPAFYGLGNAEFFTGDYQNAMTHFKIYLENKPKSEDYIKKATKNVEDCIFAINAIKNPVSFKPVNLGDSINTNLDEYWPSITADGQTIMFTRQIESGSANKGLKNNAQEDFYVSHLVNGTWSKAVPAGSPLNTPGNEGAQSIGQNGQYMFFTACDKPESYGRCDIYYSLFNGKSWSEPINAGSQINTSAWESQPSINAEGRVLFFTSNRPGGIGGMDIWYSVLNADGKWGKPKNLGPKINTKSDEMSPFIHFDCRTLYFSSNGWPGMGGYDLYMSRMLEDSTWTDPVNLGYPINTFNDETGLVIESNGTKAYFSSSQNNGKGKDIFSFDLPESLRPEPVSYLKGKVYDKETGKILTANYELINLTLAKTIINSRTDEIGNFLVCLPLGYNYGLNVNRDGYLFYSENFRFDTTRSNMDPYLKRIPLSPIKVGEKLMLYNVFYETDSWNLKQESLIELKKLYNLLADNKDVVVEIGGYTDSTGSSDHNLILSENRAKSVVNYLLAQGISQIRMKYKGYGATLPVGDNKTAEGRQLNRRTEVKILEISKPVNVK
jgi:outer membrane protein OmpA-like peptidoglycan-associated protein